MNTFSNRFRITVGVYFAIDTDNGIAYSANIFRGCQNPLENPEGFLENFSEEAAERIRKETAALYKVPENHVKYIPESEYIHCTKNN